MTNINQVTNIIVQPAKESSAISASITRTSSCTWYVSTCMSRVSKTAFQKNDSKNKTTKTISVPHINSDNSIDNGKSLFSTWNIICARNIAFHINNNVIAWDLIIGNRFQTCTANQTQSITETSIWKYENPLIAPVIPSIPDNLALPPSNISPLIEPNRNATKPNARAIQCLLSHSSRASFD